MGIARGGFGRHLWLDGRLDPHAGRTESVQQVGELGSRIAAGLVERGVRSISVLERDDNRLSSAQERWPITALEEHEWPASDSQAVVFSADAGSLNRVVGSALLENTRVRWIGGPEAGLDRDRDYIDRLSKAGKTFVPSVICGSLGLVSNLEESLGISIDLGDLRARLRARVLALRDRAIDQGVPFHTMCAEVLEGRFNLGMAV